MVVTVVGATGTGGNDAGVHGGGWPLATAEPVLPAAVAGAGEPRDAAPDADFAVWVQPAAPATKTAVIAATRAGCNFRADIEITVPRPTCLSLKSNVRQVRGTL